MDPAAEIRKFGNIATRAQLIARGVSGGDLTTAVRLGEIRRIRQAHYATPAALTDAVHATRVGGRLAGLSAARSYGLWAGFDSRLHIALRANASRLRTNVAPSIVGEARDSRATWLTPDTADKEVVLHWLATASTCGGCWRTSVAETLAQVATWSDRETAVACLDTARTVLGLDDAAIMRALEDIPAEKRMLAGRSRRGSDSGVESVVRQRLLALGIAVVQQVEFAGVGLVDMQVVGTNILIEIDGRQYHSESAAFENDRWRRNELVGRGYVVLEFSYKQIFENWAWCQSVIVSALAQFRSR
jgi:very-short-patch-repair endonuclease